MFISCHATRNEPKKRARGGDCAKRPLLTPPCAPQAHAPSFAYTIGVCSHPAVRLRPCEGVEEVKEGASQTPPCVLSFVLSLHEQRKDIPININLPFAKNTIYQPQTTDFSVVFCFDFTTFFGEFKTTSPLGEKRRTVCIDFWDKIVIIVLREFPEK